MTENEAIKKNYGLAVSISNRFYAPNPYTQEDIIQCALIGILKAYRTFNSNLNNRFSTHAYVCARNEIIKFLKKTNNEHQPLTEHGSSSSESLWEYIPDSLTDTERFVLELKLDGYSNIEIAKIMDVPRANITKLIAKYHSKIRRANA